MNWMNLPSTYANKQSKNVILPIQYEQQPTYGKGSKNGSTQIIKASKQLDYYDSWFEKEIYLDGIRIHKHVQANQPKDMIQQVKKAIQQNKDHFIISLGGDHAVTIGIVKGFEQTNKEFSYIALDAHADMWSVWNNSQYNHACVTNIVSKKHKTLLVGVRTMDVDEHKNIQENNAIQLVRDEEFSLQNVQEKLKSLKKNVYVSIDVDVFTPKLIRSTGTPEPGGLNWYDVLNTLELICKEKNVVGIDLVEFAPSANSHTEAYILAKLVNKIILFKKMYN